MNPPPSIVSDYTEDALVEKPAIAIFEDLGWDAANVYHETFGPSGTLGRETNHEAVLIARLRRALEKASVERIKALGEKFDPELHDALATTVSEEHDEGTVAVEIEPGYKMRGRVIRPARVHVTKKP